MSAIAHHIEQYCNASCVAACCRMLLSKMGADDVDEAQLHAQEFKSGTPEMPVDLKMGADHFGLTEDEFVKMATSPICIPGRVLSQ